MSIEPTDTSDAELWQQVRVDGDADAFAAVHQRYSAQVFRYCFRNTANVAEAEDLTSIVFLEMWRRRNKVQLAVDGTLLPWLYGTALNVVRNGRRAKRRHRQALATLPPPMEDPIERTTERIDAERAMADVQQRLSSLPTADQEVLVLCGWEGLDMQTAACVLGIPVGTVKSRLSRARARLKESIQRPIHEPTERGAQR